MTEAEPLQQTGRTQVLYRGRRLAYFAGCDYFRLARHPAVLRAVPAACREFGLNVSASRRTTGNHVLYQTLERELAGFFRAPAAVLLPTGYMGDLAVGQALAGHFTHALIDARSHGCLATAARFLDCPLTSFQHRDVTDLARIIKECGPRSRILILTDGMFSHDGSVAPLKEYLALLPGDGMILVDDAHGAGVLGKNGRGTVEHAGVDRRRLIQTITLSKAFGAYGGAVLASRELRDKIMGASNSFVGATPLPLPLAAAAITALRLLKANPDWRVRLFENAELVKSALRAHGVPLGAPGSPHPGPLPKERGNGRQPPSIFPPKLGSGKALTDTPGPIIPLPVATPKQVVQLRRALLAADIYPSFIQYPGGPADGYYRFVISSEHTRGQLRKLIGVLIKQVPDWSK